MVKIVGVVIINSGSTRAYTSFNEWWQSALATSSPAKRQERIKFKEKRDRLATSLANKYGIPLENMQNIGFLFSSKSQVKEAISDYETRSLLCDPETSVIIQLRLENNIVGAIAVAHNKETIKAFTSYVVTPSSSTSRWEQ